MRPSILAAAAVFGSLALWAACLPDLAALREPGEDGGAEEDAGVVLGACGDGVIATQDDGGDAGESCDPGEARPSWCPSCQVVCEGRLDEAGARCWFSLGPASSINDALARCGASGAHVATFASDRESELADEIVGGGSGYWVGLVESAALGAYAPAHAGEPGLPSDPDASCPGCYVRGGALRDPAEDGGADPECVVAGDGGWVRAPCSGEREYVVLCEREPLGRRTFFCFPLQCATVPQTAGKKRYLIDVIPRTADDARLACAQYDGGSLAMFDSREEREEILRELAALPSVVPPVTAWIGIASGDDGGTWTWDDGVAVDGTTRPLPWGASQPNGPGAGRAFVRYDVNRFDSQLAFTDDGSGETLRPSICQRGVE